MYTVGFNRTPDVIVMWTAIVSWKKVEIILTKQIFKFKKNVSYLTS